MKRVCIQWPRFGPYHLARLEVTHRQFFERGVEVIGLETAGDDSTYAWRNEKGVSSFQRETVFPDRIFSELTPSDIHKEVTARLDQLTPDAVAINSYSSPDALACLAWCRRHRRTAVVMCDSKEDDAPRVAWRERIKSQIITQFDAALLSGQPHHAYFEHLGFDTESIFIGCSVVDNEYFSEGANLARGEPSAARHLPGLEYTTPFFLASNRFIPRKNLVGLLHAYRIYQRREENPWRLVLLGDGPERPRLEAMITSHQIEGVTLAGFRQIEELPSYYGLANAFVHPPHAEQWGLVVNEAMAAGLPVLVSERAGCAGDLIRDGDNGFCFDPEEPEELARLFSHVAAMNTDRDVMGRRSKEIISDWSLDRFAVELWNAFQKGNEHADRGLNPAARSVLWAIRHSARSVTSFHTVDV